MLARKREDVKIMQTGARECMENGWKAFLFQDGNGKNEKNGSIKPDNYNVFNKLIPRTNLEQTWQVL